MASIADIWLKLKSFILEILMVTNITLFYTLVLETSVPSETSVYQNIAFLCYS